MSIRGDSKPIPVIEDVSVPVEHLAEYVGAVEKMVRRAWHHRRLLRARLRRVPPYSPAGQSEGAPKASQMMKEMADAAADWPTASAA